MVPIRCSPSPYPRACPRDRGQAQGPPRRLKPSAPLTHATTRAPCCVRRAQRVLGDGPYRPLAVGTSPPRLNPRCSASELHVLCSEKPVMTLSAITGKRVGTPKLRYHHPKNRKNLNFRIFLYALEYEFCGIPLRCRLFLSNGHGRDIDETAFRLFMGVSELRIKSGEISVAN